MGIGRSEGRLLDRLDVSDPDDELVDAAGDIIIALIAGGPGEDIDDYDAAPQLLGTFVGLLPSRTPRLSHFVVVADIIDYLRRDGWDARLLHGWTEEQRDELVAACEVIKSWPIWPSLATEGLESEHDQQFWAAERVARELGIDTFPAHWRRLHADPVGGNWYAVMQLADDQRIDPILDFAMTALFLETLGTGPAESHGHEGSAEFQPRLVT